MVETRERDVVYTSAPGDGPSAALIVLFSVLIIAVLGAMIYYFSNSNLATQNPTTIIERDTRTTVPMPVPTAPSAPSVPDINMPDVNVTPPVTTPSAPAPEAGAGGGSGEAGSTP